jgi:carboxyl-terminal processing protease
MAALLLLSGFVAGAGADKLGWLGETGVNASSSLVDSPAFKTFQQAWDVVHENYIGINSVSDQSLIYGAANGMVAALNDPGHSEFLTPDQVAAFNAQENSQFVGVGIQIDNSTGAWVILVVYQNSPAERAGIKVGDEITYVGKTAVQGMSMTDIGNLLKGKEGTSVTMTVHRPSDNSDHTVTMTREKITIALVNWTMLPDKVGYVQLVQFNAGASQDLKAALDAATKAGATSFIFDLRDNPGGLGLEAVKVASLFLPEGSVVYQEQDAPNAQKYSQKTIGISPYTKQPMVVLINAQTASAAEIVSAALRDNGRATLIGETTFGTGTGTNEFPLDDGSAVRLGVSLWFTPKGKSLWHVGVAPDQTVALPTGVYGLTPDTAKGFSAADIEASGDAQLKTGFEMLTSTKR